ncbi:MAG: alpha/beta hydrolase [Bacteroidota bacterium]
MNSIYYKEKGEGPILVFLHGYCESHKIWDVITPELILHSKVITLDLPGFGKSPLLKTPFTISEVSNAVIGFLIAKGIQKCIIIGHSMGGYVALAMAKERPDLLEGLCLFHSTAESDGEEKKINRDRVIEFVKKNGVWPFIETFVPGLFFKKESKNIEKAHKIAIRTTKKALISYAQAMRDRPDMTSFLRTLSIPVLFLAGEQDSIISTSSLSQQAKSAQHGKMAVLTNVGHMAMFEDSHEVIQLLKSFARTCFPSVTI